MGSDGSMMCSEVSMTICLSEVFKSSVYILNGCQGRTPSRANRTVPNDLAPCLKEMYRARWLLKSIAYVAITRVWIGNIQWIKSINDAMIERGEFMLVFHQLDIEIHVNGFVSWRKFGNRNTYIVKMEMHILNIIAII